MSESPRPTTETAIRMREETPTTAHGSRTLILEEVAAQSAEESSDDNHVGVLRLRGDMNSRRPRAIQWDDSVIDNEHMNKKKTKICCIYHKPHAIGESSDESSSSSDSDNASESEDERRLPHKNGKCTHKHHDIKKKKRNPREVSPNAYERQPVYNKDRSSK